jgi:hypothetical protein
MLVNLSGATYQEKSILSNLMQIYLYELSTTSTLEIEDTGQFPYPNLDDYWSDMVASHTLCDLIEIWLDLPC